MATIERDPIPKGQDLTVGSYYRITEIDPADFAPSLHVGDVVLCAPDRAGCIDPTNRESDGMGTQWFADLSSDEEVGFQTLVNGVELAEAPSPEPPKAVIIDLFDAIRSSLRKP